MTAAGLVDTLMHAVHDHGALAPMFVRGSKRQVMELLDEIAGHR